MFNQIFVSDMSQTKVLTPEQAKEALDAQKNTRIRVGTIAVEENLMTPQQVETVNQLQASLNARFGDIAVQKGYLTEEQVMYLLKKQPREHIILKQILCDKQIMDADRFERALNDFKVSLGVDDEVFDKLQSNDAGTYISHIAGIDCGNLIMSEYAKLFVTLLIRLIDREVLVKKAYTANPDSLKLVATQKAVGDATVSFAFSSADDISAKSFAESYAKCSFDTFDEDVEDSLMEFLNCVIGMMVSELSNKDIMELDIEPPEFSIKSQSDAEVLVLPITLSFGEYYLYVNNFT
jgi:CheY-specific phosphatase CheX